MYIKEQIENFEVSSNVIVNLIPGEELIYKLKIKFFTQIRIWSIIFLFLAPISFIVMLYLLFIIKLFTNFFSISITFIIFPIVVIYLSKNLKIVEFSIFLSDKKIYMFGERKPLIYTADIIDLSSLQALIMVQTNSKKDWGKIEFIFKDFKSCIKPNKKFRKVTPILKNISKVFQIFESVILQYGNIEERLKSTEVEAQNVHKFYGSEKNSSLIINNDNILLKKDSTTTNINFNPKLYLNFIFDTIVIKSSNEKNANIVEFKPFDDFFNVLEVIYFKYLFWKNNIGLLLNHTELSDLQDQLKHYEVRMKDYKEKNTLNPIKSPEKKFNSFLNYLKKNEKIFILYCPHKVNEILRRILAFLIIIYLYFAIISILNLPIDNLILFIVIFLGSLVIFIPLIIAKYIKYVFTSQRIILGHDNKIYSIPYYNMLGITCQNKRLTHVIEFHLKHPFEELKPFEQTKFSIESLKRIDLFLRIIKIINLNNQ